jgi:endogenous inhibitor of DNA gyrase (YacG/DUF329 family)
MPGVKCPICGKVMSATLDDWPQFPFCSERCKLIDLGRWLGEDYSIPAEEPPDDASPEADEASGAT